MLTSAETRRARLLELVKQHADSHGKRGMPNLCERLGLARNDAAKLARIANGNIRRDRGEDKLYNLGDGLAREIEEKLDLPRGWMDTPPGYEDADDPAIRQMVTLISKLSPSERSKAMRLLDAFAEPTEPPAPNGTTG